MTLEEMKRGNLAQSMEPMLKVFCEEEYTEYHFYVEKGELKYWLS